MLRAAAFSLTLVLALSAGCGGKTHTSETTNATGCSDSRYTETVWPRLVDLKKAVIQVDAGHGDIALLDVAAPGLVSTAGSTIATAQANKPCKPGLVRADGKLLAATRMLSRAGHELTQLTAAAKKGKDYSGFQSLFLESYYSGTDGFEAALTALRSAGAPSLVKASDGQAIFLDAGCSVCHTLAVARAKSTVGPDLDAVKPSKAAVVVTVTNGQGVMLAFNGMLTTDQIRSVAEFVSQSAGK